MIVPFRGSVLRTDRYVQHAHRCTHLHQNAPLDRDDGDGQEGGGGGSVEQDFGRDDEPTLLFWMVGGWVGKGWAV